MKKLFFIAVVISILAVFFASASPDGLDFVSEKLGFAERAVDHPGLPYTVGVFGVFLTAGIFWSVGKLSKLIIILLLILFSSSPVFAARPLVTDDYGTVDLGAYELETGYNFISPKVGGNIATGLVFQLKRGFSPSFDLGLEVPYNTSAVSGLADLVLHAKFKLKEFGEEEGLTARADIKLTNGDAARSLGSGFLDYGFIMILSKKIAGMNGHLNLGYTVIGDAANSTADDTFAYGAAIEKMLRDGVDLVAEFTGLSSKVNVLANLQFGGRYQINDLFRLDAGYSIGMNDNSNNIATFGLTSEF